VKLSTLVAFHFRHVGTTPALGGWTRQITTAALENQGVSKLECVLYTFVTAIEATLGWTSLIRDVICDKELTKSDPL
jgi:hypothetical protein